MNPPVMSAFEPGSVQKSITFAAAIQQRVITDDETVLLEYSIGSERSYVWAVTRDHVKSYKLPAGSEVDEAARRVYKALAVSDTWNGNNR